MAKRRDRDPAAGLLTFMDWCMKEGYQSVFEEDLYVVYDLYEDAMGESAEVAIAELGETVFDIVIGACAESFAGNEFEQGGYLVDEFLGSKGQSLREVEREYLKKLSRSCPGLYEVVEVVPKSHVVVRDFFQGGEPFRVNEVSGSQSLVRWNWVFARVLELDGSCCFSGTCLRLGAAAREDVASFVRYAAKSKLKEVPKLLRKSPGQTDLALRAALRESPPVALAGWLAETVRQSQGPELAVTGGDPLCPTELSFSLHEAPEELAALLEAAPDFSGTGPTRWNWMPDSDEDGGIIHAFVTLESEALIAQTLSSSRADRFEERIGDLLGARVELASREEPGIGAHASWDTSSGPADEPMDPELEAKVVGEFLSKHYRKILDEPIPMLGNRAPRECVKTAKGRAEVVNWLKTLESGEEERSIPLGRVPFDFLPMWEELGILDLRK